MISFDQYIEEKLIGNVTPMSTEVIFTFGRFNPPTIGHEKLIRNVQKLAISRHADHFIFASRSGPEKGPENPIPYAEKINLLDAAFPDVQIADIDNAINPFQAAYYLRDLGYKKATLICGEDRKQKYTQAFAAYIQHPDASKAINMEFAVVSAGFRDPDSNAVEGASATKARQAAAANDFRTFQQMSPQSLPRTTIRRMFELVRAGL